MKTGRRVTVEKRQVTLAGGSRVGLVNLSPRAVLAGLGSLRTLGIWKGSLVPIWTKVVEFCLKAYTDKNGPKYPKDKTVLFCFKAFNKLEWSLHFEECTYFWSFAKCLNTIFYLPV